MNRPVVAMICARCSGPIVNQFVPKGHQPLHDDPLVCIEWLRSRADALAAEVERLTAEVAALRAQLVEEEWLPIGTFDGEFGEWWVWNGIEVARGYYGYEQWWDEWPGYDAARPLRAGPTHYCAVRQPTPPP